MSRTISVEFIQAYLESLGQRHGIVAAMVCWSLRLLGDPNVSSYQSIEPLSRSRSDRIELG